MTTSFPTSLDSLVNPTPTKLLVLDEHQKQHANLNDAVLAIETAVLPIVGGASRIVFVSSASDFPDAVAGVRTLAANTCYFLTRDIDLQGDRLVCSANTVLLGTSSESSRLKSTGLTGTALITSAYSLPMRFLAIEADVALNLDAVDSNQAIDWMGVNFVDTPTVGTVKGFSNFIMADSAFLNSSGMTFDGSIGTIAFDTCLLNAQAGGTIITIPATATIARRFRVVYSSLIVLAGETGINVSASATIPVEGYILDTVNFSGGGTYITGIQHSDTKAQFVNVRGVTNSASIANYYMNGNATATVVGSANNWVKIAGTTSAGTYVQRFTLANNKATYTGALDLFFEVKVVGDIAAQNNRIVGFRVAKNETTLAETEIDTNSEGTTRSAPLYIQGVVELSTDDFIEIYVANLTDGTDVTVQDLNVIIVPLG